MPAAPGMAFLEPVEAQQKMDMLARAEPYQLAHQASLARLQNAQATEAETRVKQEQQMSAIMAGMGGTPRDRLEKATDAALRVGNINGAQKMLQGLAAVDAHEATLEFRQYQLQQARLRDEGLRAKLTSDMAAWVSSLPEEQRASAWEEGVKVLEQQPGMKVPPQYRTYNPTLMGALTAQGMSAYQRTQAEAKRLDEERAKREEERKKRESEARVKELEARARADDARADRMRKLEGKPSAQPRAKVTEKEVSTFIETDDALKHLSPEEKKQLSFVASSEANALLQSIPGLRPDEAAARALQRAKERGDVKPPPADTRSFWEKIPLVGKEAPPSRPTYKPGGAAKSAPEKGAVEDGYEFLGGDPADQRNWKKVQ